MCTLLDLDSVTEHLMIKYLPFCQPRIVGLPKQDLCLNVGPKTAIFNLERPFRTHRGRNMTAPRGCKVPIDAFCWSVEGKLPSKTCSRERAERSLGGARE